MNVMRKMWPYLLACALVFCAIPLMDGDTGGLMVLLLIAAPIICLLSSLIYGIRNGFNLLYSLYIGILFGAVILIFLNNSTWIYLITYIGISMVGNFAGSLFYKRANQL